MLPLAASGCLWPGTAYRMAAPRRASGRGDRMMSGSARLALIMIRAARAVISEPLRVLTQLVTVCAAKGKEIETTEFYFHTKCTRRGTERTADKFTGKLNYNFI